MCESPDKLAFRSLRAAAEFSYDQLLKFGRVLRPYACSCDSYHLTSSAMELGGQLTPAMVIAIYDATRS